MQLLSIELKGYLPLKSKGVDFVKLEFTELVQIFLGRNGDGKSSLLRECSMLPPENGSYAKAGYKIARARHNDALYETACYPGSPMRCSFVKDGVELNEGRTQAAQKELVKDHFGMTSEIHDFLLGVVNGTSFTSMAPGKRKEWIMRWYPNDMTYVTDFYDRARKELRDTSGAVKNINKRLADELGKRKQLGDLNEDQLRESLSKIEGQRNDVIMLLGQTKGIDNPQQELQQLQTQLQTVVQRLLGNPVFDWSVVRPIDSIDRDIRECDEAINGFEHLRRSHSTELEVLGQKLAEQNLSDESIEDLRAHYQVLVEKHTACSARLSEVTKALDSSPIPKLASLLIAQPESVHRTFVGVADELIGVVRTIPEIDSTSVTLRGYHDKLQLTTRLDDEYADANRHMRELTHRYNHLKSADKNECPKCMFRWIPGVSGNDIKALERDIENQQLVLNNIDAARKENAAFLSLYENWYYPMMTFVRLTRNYTELAPVWEYLMGEYDLRYKGGRELCIVIPSLTSYLKEFHQHRVFGDEIKALEQKIQLIEKGGMRYELDRYDQLDKLIGGLIQDKRTQISLRDTLVSERDAIEEFLAESAKLTVLQERINNLFTQLCHWNLGQFATTQLMGLNEEKRVTNNLLMESSGVEHVLRNLKSNLASLNERQDGLSALTRSLSPTDGFVAEMLGGFVEQVVNNVNAIIQGVWSTPLIVKPCAKDDGGLNFVFPAIANSTGGVVKDIGMCSAGEQEIINQAFRLVGMKYMGMSKFPTYMDEVGANFDEVHRPRFINFVRRLVEKGEHGQFFMISHYITQHGAFPHAEICALSTEGLSIPEGYNKHVTIK